MLRTGRQVTWKGQWTIDTKLWETLLSDGIKCSWKFWIWLTASPPVPFYLQVCEQSCAALCMLALRKPENCRVIMEGGGALAALQAMKMHPREVTVQVLMGTF